jgi:hypothetical protein
MRLATWEIHGTASNIFLKAGKDFYPDSGDLLGCTKNGERGNFMNFTAETRSSRRKFELQRNPFGRLRAGEELKESDLCFLASSQFKIVFRCSAVKSKSQEVGSDMIRR